MKEILITPRPINKENFSKTLGIEDHMTNRALRAFETFGNDNNISYEEFKKYKV